MTRLISTSGLLSFHFVDGFIMLPLFRWPRIPKIWLIIFFSCFCGFARLIKASNNVNQRQTPHRKLYSSAFLTIFWTWIVKAIFIFLYSYQREDGLFKTLISCLNISILRQIWIWGLYIYICLSTLPCSVCVNVHNLKHCHWNEVKDSTLNIQHHASCKLQVEIGLFFCITC